LRPEQENIMHRRNFLLATAAFAFSPAVTAARDTRPWGDILARARGQTVFWNAWGGDESTNAFIAWAGRETQRLFDVTINHVRLRDTAEAVTRVVAEKQANRTDGGSVDLIWINGPNFLAMKTQNLLFGPFVETLPNWRYVDTVSKRSNIVDFTVPVDGFAAPWRMAQIVFVYDSAHARREDLPTSMAAMVDFAKRNPGRLTHPNARNFLGATFLKQALHEFAPDPSALAKPATDESFGRLTEPLWAWYQTLRPLLWREGREFPESGPAQRQLLNDGEIDLLISFNPAEAAVSIADRLLPPTARVHVLERGSIGNTSFVAIPFNAANREGAMVVANFLLDPTTQARAQDPKHLGNFTVLDLSRLSAADQERFHDLSVDPALPTNEMLGPLLQEPHPTWMTRLTAEWERRVVR
jgi:putative thiamine transport system substrate-binding protein